MNRRVTEAALFVFAGLGVCACSNVTPPGPIRGQTVLVPQAPLPRAKPTQYLYVYNAGVPGIYTGEYARYSLPDLALQETTATTGVASPPAFGNGALPYFIDEATGHGGFAVYLQPAARHKVAAQQQFYGIPCQSSSLSIGPSGTFYAVQYCSANVLEYKGAGKKGGSEKPIARYTGGNLGMGGITNPISAIVDPNGNLYVGDNRGGVTYFAAGSRAGVVAFPTGNGGYVNQMVVDRHGDVWSVHGPNPTAVNFTDTTTCIPNPSGTIVRNEIAERFSKGKLVQQLYTAVANTRDFTNNGISIAVDSDGRVYVGGENSDAPGIVVDFDPGTSCPRDRLSLTFPLQSTPLIAVDAQRRFYVTNYIDNTVSAYFGASTRLINRVKQNRNLAHITYAAINP